MTKQEYSSKLTIAANENIKEKNYWLNKLSGELAKNSFPYDSQPANEEDYTKEKVESELSEELSLKLISLSNKSDNRLYMILVSAVYVLLYKYSGGKDLVIGTPIYKQQADTDLINTVLPLRMIIEDITFKQLILNVRQTIAEGIKNHAYPIEILLDQLEQSHPEIDFPLLDTAVLLENIHDKNYLSRVHPNIIFSFGRKAEILHITVDYNALFYEKASIKKMINHYKTLMKKLLLNTDTDLDCIDILSDQEKNQVLVDFNQTIENYPNHKMLHEGFEEQGQKTPDHIAVVFANRSLTYKELNERSGQLAGLLQAEGVKANRIAAVIIKRSLEMIISILAVLKAGGAYLPIDPDYPQERIRFIQWDSKPDLLLTTSTLDHQWDWDQEKILVDQVEFGSGVGKSNIGQQKSDSHHPHHCGTIAYIIYTSGSTGKPKGVLVEHRNVTAYLHAFDRVFTITQTDIVIQQASYSFDVFVEEVYPALHRGGKLVIPGKEEVRDIHLLSDVIAAHSATIISCTPLMLKILNELHQSKKIKTLRVLISGGDTLKREYIENLMKIGTVYNTYGPTETTVCATYYQCIKELASHVPIGKPIANYQVYILDHNRGLLPGGVAGELSISGAGVSRGYLNRPELTNNKFLIINDKLKMEKVPLGQPMQPCIHASMPYQSFPHHPITPSPHSPIYLTGDLARWLSDGNIEFLGRIDQQVKIRGFRIEPGEIEASLMQQEVVREALVVEREDKQGENYLCAYIVPKGDFSVSVLRKYLQAKLPDYMVPSHFVRINQIPLTVHGKVDRNALPEPVMGTRSMTYITGEMLKNAVISPQKKKGPDTVMEDRDETYSLTEEQSKKILYSFNQTEADYPGDKLISELFAEQVTKTPDNIALVFDHQHLDYRQLHKKSNQLARVLRSRGIAAGAIIGILVERSLKMIIGILGIFKAGGAFMPIDPDSSSQRQQFMLDDAQAALLLTTGSLNIAKYASRTINLDNPGNYSRDGSNLPLINSPTDISHVLYTSGSTGVPKGVLLENRSLVNLMTSLAQLVSFSESDNVGSFTPITFDVFSAETLMPLTKGSKVTVVNIDNIMGFKEVCFLIEERSITIFQSAPSALQRFMSDPVSSGRFKALRYLVSAGEPLLDSVLEQLRIKIPGRIFNLYGPTETTLYSTAKDVSAKKSLNIGKPIANTRTYILGKDQVVQPIGVSGELSIGGHGVARGYMNRPELTREKFVPNPFVQGDRIYKTGDICQWLPDGNIELIGRIDHQVKISGIRIELGEIENCLLTHEDIKEAVVVLRENDKGEEYLCACLVSEKFPDEYEIRNYLAKKLFHYMIPAVFVQLEKIPLTPHRKSNRTLLAAMEIAIDSDTQYAAPTCEIEEKVAKVWSEVLGIEQENIGIDSNFFELGGHSLRAITIIAHIQNELNVRIPLVELFRTPTIRSLADYIKESELPGDRFSSLQQVEKKEYYQLSSSQQRLYVLQEVQLENVVYNIPQVMLIEGRLNKERLEDTFRQLVNRHESLRTSFHMLDNEPVQKIHDNIEFDIEYYGAERKTQSAERKEERHAPCAVRCASTITHFIRFFDLSQIPLLRVGVIELTGQQHILMVDMHHIVTDGISMELLVREFAALYEGEKLSPLKFQYKNYSEWQNSEKQKTAIKTQEQYWLNQFRGEIPVLDLPIDYPRPAVQNFEGDIVKFELSGEETRGFNDLALAEGATLYMILLAVTSVWLSKLSNQEDIIIGTPTAGRPHQNLERIIGMFINTLAVRNFPEGRKTFRGFLKEVKEKALQSLENQEYQFEDLVEKATVTRDVSRNPLFDTVLLLQNIDVQDRDIPEIEISGFKLKPYEFKSNTTKFDLELVCTETEDKLLLGLKYCIKLFKKETIERFIAYFKKIVSLVVKKPGRKLWQIEIISEKEKKLLLFDFNRTGAAYPKSKTIHQLFAEQAARTPDNIAVIGQSPGAIHESPLHLQISYNELNDKSHQLAALLKNRGIGPGSTAAIMTDPSIETIVAVMGVLKSGGCYLPLDPQNPGERINYILKDSETTLLITQAHLVKQLDVNIQTMNIESGRLYKDKIEVNLTALPAKTSGPGDPVYIIYTSGTTGKPKGTLLKHENLVNYVFWFSGETHLTDEDKSVLTASFAFDLGYTTIYPSLLQGAQLHILPKETYMVPESLLDYIRSRRISYLKMTPSLFSPLLASSLFSGETCQSLRLVILGGEAINVTDVEKAYRICRHLEIMNHYGPTEVTIGCIAQFIARENLETYKTRPAIGRPILNTKAYILDKYLQVLPPGAAGELCLSGAGAASGYLNNPELTAQKFQVPNKAWYYRSYRSYKSDILYKTGDLARWLADGNIEFLGRIDQQIKIRGFRIELGEIEHQLITHENIKEAAVVAKTGETGDQYLCAYIVSDRESQLTGTGLTEFLSMKLPDYMIPSYFVFLDAIPLTPNGKIDRKVLPEPGIKTKDKAYIAPRNQIEEQLVEIWSETLALSRKQISIDANFFQLGGHSLRATIMISRVHKKLQVRVPLAEIFKTPDIRSLSKYISGLKKDVYTSIEPVEKKEYYALSSAQQRLYILYQMTRQSIAYNLPRVVPLAGTPSIDQLKRTFNQLLARHESLRTSFHLVKEEPVQRVHDQVEFEIEYYCAERKAQSAERKEERQAPGAMRCASTIKNFIRPFDLDQAPLLRVGLIQQEKMPLLLVDMHHIISDGVSRRILVSDFLALDRDLPLPELRIYYKDFAGWQNRSHIQKTIQSQEGYWLKVFADEIPVLNLPADFVRPAVQSFAGSSLAFDISAARTRALNQLLVRQGVTLYILLLAAFNVLLAKLSGQEDIVVGTPVAGRRHADLEPIIGMFVNTLCIRNYPVPGHRFIDLLREVKVNALEAFENQEYSFEDLVEKVDVKRDASRNPLFDVMFVLQNIERGPQPAETPDFEPTPYKFENKIAKFDLTLLALEQGDKLVLAFEYCTKLFKAENIQRFSQYFKTILSIITAEQEIKISDLEIISEQEKNHLLYDFNDTAADYPNDKPIHELFEEQVEKTPDQIAVVGAHQLHQLHEKLEGTRELAPLNITYRELNQQSNQLARILREQGISRDTVVGLLAEPCVRLMIGIMGILKASAAYLPIDPNTPAARIEYILNDSAVLVLLYSNQAAEKIAFNGTRIHLDQQTLLTGNRSNAAYPCQPGNLAYMIYTSGSTGRPKGVGVEHRQLINFVYHMYNRYDRDVSCHDRCLGLTNIMFDVSVWEFFLPLVFGARLVILPGQKRFDVLALAETILDEGITLIYLPPGLLKPVNELLTKQWRRLRLNKMLVGVEPIRDEVLEAYMRLNPGMKIINGYGPTETTICASSLNYVSHPPRGAIVPIGAPLSNNQIVLLDAAHHLVPLGIAGEIYISGHGVSRGYLNNPELTAKKFFDKALSSLLLALRRTETAKNVLSGRNQSGAFQEIPVASNQERRANFTLRAKSQELRAKLYGTGDLACWLPDGNIRFLGRVDDQVKIRGFRIEPGEIENQLVTYPEVKNAVVLTKKDKSGDKYLCAYVIPGKKLSTTAIKQYLSKDLPDYMIPSYFVFLEAIPLTPNGKIDRKVLPEPGIKTKDKAYIAPRNQIEEQLVEIWSETLALSRKQISIDANFFQLGGHSLRATIMISRVHKKLQVRVPLAEIFKTPDIRSLSKYISALKKDVYTSIEPVEKKEYYVLSSAQERLYILQQMDPQSTAYNIPQLVPLDLTGEINKKRLEQTIYQLIKRHESFRTSFAETHEQPVQRIHDTQHLDFEIEYYHAAGSGSNDAVIENIFNQFVRPFSLYQVPIARVGLIMAGEQTIMLMVDMHHIISDLLSRFILEQDFMSLMTDRELFPLRIQYKDYAQWQHQRESVKSIKHQEEYWLKEYEGQIPLLNLPMDYERGEKLGFAGSSIYFSIDGVLVSKINQCVGQFEVTLMMFLFSIYNILLCKYADQEELVVGTVTAGRQHADLENTIGFFVNMLAIKTCPYQDKTFAQYLLEVKEKAVNAYENQGYPFEELVSHLDIPRHPGRHPLVDAVFAFQNTRKTPTPAESRGDRTGEDRDFTPLNITHFDLMLYATNAGDLIHMVLQYSTDLFKTSSIEELKSLYMDILEQVVENPYIELKQISFNLNLMTSSSNILQEDKDAWKL